MAAASSASLTEALVALDAAVSDLIDAPVDTASCPELLDALDVLERIGRRLPVAGQEMVARLGREATPVELGGSPLRKVLADRLLISSGEAKGRIEDAAVLTARVGLTGEVIDPALPATAAAQARGQVGREQVAIIRDTIDHLPAGTPPWVVAEAEVQLACYRSQFRPEVFRKVARRMLDTIHPDGEFDDRERARKRGLRLGAQCADGLSWLSGWVTSELRATLEPGLHKLAAPGMCNPDDQNPCTSGVPSEAQIQGDGRSPAQRNHDAMLAMVRSALMSGELGRHHGLPVTVIVSTTLQDLEAGAGHGLTAGGTLVPMSDVIRLAAHAHHCLCIFDKATGASLNLFRTKRCASEGQRIVLHAKDRGCSHPGCTVPAYLCEVHHVEYFAVGGNTNIDDLTLACRAHHRLLGAGGWITRKRADGRTEWIPPPEADRGEPRTNDYHHPERLLGEDN
jgi:Domain of unknown function (DUF222)